jgi:hypothetical protein
MNTNRISTTGFSNPDTERLFASWHAEEVERYSEKDKQCAFCEHGFFLHQNLTLVLCLNPDSPHCHETVEIWFTCPRQEQRSMGR